jgi:hypothetical protein
MTRNKKNDLIDCSNTAKRRLSGTIKYWFVTDAWLAATVVAIAGLTVFIAFAFADQTDKVWTHYALWAWSNPLGLLALVLPVIAGSSAWTASRQLESANESWRHTLAYPFRHVYVHMVPTIVASAIILIAVNVRIAAIVPDETVGYRSAFAYSVSTQFVGLFIAVVIGSLIGTVWRSRWSALASFVVTFVLVSGAVFEHTPFVVDGRGNVSAGYVPNWEFLAARFVLLAGLLFLLTAALRINAAYAPVREMLVKSVGSILGFSLLVSSMVMTSGKYDQNVDENAWPSACRTDEDNLSVCVLPENTWLLDTYYEQYRIIYDLFESSGVDAPRHLRQFTPYQAVRYQAGVSLVSENELYFQVLPKETELLVVDPFFPLCPAELDSLARDSDIDIDAIASFDTQLVAAWLLNKEVSAVVEGAIEVLEANSNVELREYLTDMSESDASEMVESVIRAGATCDIPVLSASYDDFVNWLSKRGS